MTENPKPKTPGDRICRLRPGIAEAASQLHAIALKIDAGHNSPEPRGGHDPVFKFKTFEKPADMTAEAVTPPGY